MNRLLSVNQGLPSPEHIKTISDKADLGEVYNPKRHLLYVACTRAREQLSISGVDPASEFLDDPAQYLKVYMLL